jgi:glycosyltransferase involved in cell wall biosynthesis
MDPAREGAYALDRPAVTVVIPTHDRAQLLQRAVRSALGQTFANLEVIVVDDASAEAARVETFDPRVRVIRLDRPAGVCAARNLGLREARGRWVVVLDDDDELLPEMLRISLEAVHASPRPTPISALSGMAVVNAAGETLDVRFPISLDRGGQYFSAGDVRSIQDANTLFAPTETLRGIGGWNETYEAFENDDLLLRLTRASSIEGVRQVTYRMHRHTTPHLSGDSRRMIRGAERTMREYQDLFDAHPKKRAVYLARLGALYLDAREWRRAVSALWTSFRLDPAAPRALPRLLVGIAGPGAYQLVRLARRSLRSP